MIPSSDPATVTTCPDTFNRVFFQYQPPRPLAEIDAELAGVEQRILELLREVTE
jgi:hypothetical protein